MNVEVDGVFIGPTPINNHPVAPGVHTIVLKKSGYRDIPRTLAFEAGKERVLARDLREDGIRLKP
jgi:hypothetical protein